MNLIRSNVLIVIPDVLISRSVEYVLNMAYVLIDTTRIEDVKDSLSFAKTGYFDIILIDETIKGISINDYITVSRISDPTQKILVLGAENGQDPDVFFENGCFGYLKFPWNIDQLKLAVKELAQGNYYKKKTSSVFV